MSNTERKILQNQYRILALLDRENAGEYAKKAEILYNGFTAAYSEVLGLMPEISEAVCTEVQDILDMFRALALAVRSGVDCTGIPRRALQFSGFDGNHEIDHMVFTRYVTQTRGGWAELSITEGKLNSHTLRLYLYRPMLSRWRQSRDQWKLTREDLLRILPQRTSSQGIE